MTRVYYKYAIAAVIVFDLSRPATFEAVLKWRDDVNSKVVLANGEPIPALLLANKCDLPGVTVNADQLNSFCTQHGFIGWFQTSAQDNVNIGTFLRFLSHPSVREIAKTIDEAMKTLIAKVLDVAKTNSPPPQPTGTHLAL